jgi:hypothetical protein
MLLDEIMDTVDRLSRLGHQPALARKLGGLRRQLVAATKTLKAIYERRGLNIRPREA